MELTEFQEEVLRKLREHECWHLAAMAEEKWRDGKPYYIDSRVSLPKKVRADFKKANPN